jgi:predicted RND superfamily exporter protein
MFLILYGLKSALIAFVVNFLPIVVTLGFLVSMGDSFDFATVIIAGIAIGFCVDDTIHMMHHFKKHKTKSQKLAILNSVRVLYRPLLLTTVILGICFFSFYFSSMVVTQKFGFYTLFAIVLAFLSDIILLPALVFTFDRKSQKRTIKQIKLQS